MSGIRTIKDSNIDLNNNKNVTIIAAVLTLGVSGAVCNFGVVSIGTTALAMIVGIVLNLVLKDRKSILIKEKPTVAFTNTKTGESFDVIADKIGD